ncbi:MAG: 6-bladed beta-propeller, partial [Gemmatimonadales bacterium]
MTPGRFIAGIAAVLSLSGCADRPAPAVTTASDSAGVHIVKNAAPALEPPMAWRLDSTPVMEIGAELEYPERDLSQVAGAYRLHDGRIAIMNAGNSQLQFYDSTGNWIKTVGREGRGPGEFQSPYGFWRRPGDTLVVFDFQSRRIT